MTAMADQTVWKIELIIPEQSNLPTFMDIIDGFTSASSYRELVEGGAWIIEGFSEGMPIASDLDIALELGAIKDGIDVPASSVQIMPQIDWVSENQKSFKPIEAGRFFVYSSYYDGIIPRSSLSLKIDASTAFGTGEHGTTHGCLMAIHDLAKACDFVRPLDLGCGTGILGMAVAKAFNVTVVASDIDEDAVLVTKNNADINHLDGFIHPLHSVGFAHRFFRQGAKFDLIVANILANPLQKLAPDMAKHCEDGGVVILSGLLRWQEQQVRQTYRNYGFRIVRRYPENDWMTLVLQKN